MHHHARYPLIAAVAACLWATAAWAQKTAPPATIHPPEEPPPSRSTVERIPEARDSTLRRIGTPQRSARRGNVEGTLRLGEMVRGELTGSDRRAPDNTHYEDWSYRGRPGTRVSIAMSSREFDTFLIWGRMLGGVFVPLVTDDDGGEESDSRLTVWIRDDRDYVVRANSFRTGTGRFRLMVEEAEPRSDAGAPRGTLRPGQTVRGELAPGDAVDTRGAYREVWRFRGHPGQRVTFAAASREFDTQIFWARMEGEEALPLRMDDDGGEGSNSELTVEVEEEGEYAVIVRSTGTGEAGVYTLQARGFDGRAYSLLTQPAHR